MTSIGILLVIGLLVEFGEKFLPLGYLPGDIHITGAHGSIYFPVATCVVISVILSVLLNFFGR
ncbi:DUF2905 domain-containing protein [Selenomonas bovis]|uniref:DUF2905 domain-containing protein n=1 Tax=Selenomonas bovis TaxID=416586 RepID=UPI0003647CBF|nr:DUF2905 domain-containing protein [Selenomonas bovis]